MVQKIIVNESGVVQPGYNLTVDKIIYNGTADLFLPISPDNIDA